jgi:hypothetical protein
MSNDVFISRQTVLESIKNLYPDMPIMDIMGARRKWLKKYAPYFECENAVEQLPSVTPMQKSCDDVLDKIKAEITAIAINGQFDNHTMFIRTGEQVKRIALDIIDKYKAESEDKE